VTKKRRGRETQHATSKKGEGKKESFYQHLEPSLLKGWKKKRESWGEKRGDHFYTYRSWRVRREEKPGILVRGGGGKLLYSLKWERNANTFQVAEEEKKHTKKGKKGKHFPL